jgi:EmrB/QacA subfamily drug resistance transporter
VPEPRPGASRPNLTVVLVGLMLAMLLAMLDNMIVSTALPRIAGEFKALDELSWVVTAYVLGTTVSTPIWGKIGDLYGRKSIFLGSVIGFLAGSALCGMSQSMSQLIGFRALQGIAAGGLMVGVMAIIGDLVPPRERGKYQGQMAGVMAIAMIAGPLVGGFITDHLSWRWAFYVNLPVGGLALLVLVTTLRLPKYRTEHRIDWVGAGLLSIGVTGLVLITTWGGTEYPWGSWQILGLAVLAAVALAAFVLVERRAAEPIIPLGLFRTRNFAVVSVVGFLLGFGMMGSISFLPIYQQTVQKASATNSGLLLLPMMAGVLVVSVLVGQAITKTGRYRWFPIIGGVVMSVGMLLFSQLTTATTKLTTSVYMVVLGVGMGFLMQTTMLIAQNSVQLRDIGVASSTATFFRSIGGSFGVSLFGAIFASRFKHDIALHLPASLAGKVAGGGNARLDPKSIAGMPEPLHGAVLHAIATGAATIFLVAGVIMVLVPILASLITEVPLRSSADAATAAPSTEPEPALAS